MAPTKFECTLCSKSFSRRYDLDRHKRTVHGGESSKCNFCGQNFSRKDSYLRHLKSHHQQGGGPVGEVIENKTNENIDKDESQTGKDGSSSENNEEFDCFTKEEAIDGNLRKYTMEGKGKFIFDPLSYLKSKEDEIRSILRREVLRKNIKYYLTMQVRFKKQKGDVIEATEPHFHGRCHILLKPEDIEHSLRESVMKMINSFIEYQREGSNWTLDRVMNVNIHIATYIPIKGSSYLPLPAKLAKKKAIVNPQNNDHKCFMWSVLAAIHPVNVHPERIINYVDHTDDLDFSDIPFPVKVADIPKFEKRNDMSVNVFGYERGILFPLHLTKERGVRLVNILVINEGEKSYYCWIKNLNRLLGNGDDNQHHYCHYCLHGFTKKRLLKKHILYCQVHGAQRTEMPCEENKWLQFEEVKKQLKVPYVVYADFESILEQQHGCQPDPSKASTIKLARHIPSGFTYKVVGLNQELTEDHITYRGPDTIKVFVDHMVNLEERLIKVMSNPKPLLMTDDDHQVFREATHCHICGKMLNHDRVRDHCHISGKFRGAAHNECNLKFQLTKRIPVFFHNLRGYDAHHIMSEIGKMKRKNLKCIPQNHEKYISFSLGKLDFLDTFQFMSTSLENLVENLAEKGISKFPHLKSYVETTHPENPNIKLQLLTRKGVYPYRYMDSFERFNETSLPHRNAFYNDLVGKDISDADYKHAERVWDVFKTTDLGKYHDLYMESDVHLLVDVFENFRNLCLEMYGLDAAHFYTAPGLAWQAALKMTGVQLELLTDPDMHLFIEKGLRGGIAMISKRYAKANNPYLSDHDPREETNYLLYLDANNLYGWGMSQTLPTHGFEWINPNEVDHTSIPEEGDTGYIFEVDLEYPRELHDSHSDYPLAAESFQIKPEMLSKYQDDLLEKLGMKAGSATKLVPNLYDKKNYVVHYRNLQLYLSLGMKVSKVHRAIKFHQSPWLKPYIEFNTNMRKQARNQFEKDFYKLMNNSVFGKTMENLRKRVNVELVHKEKRLVKLTAKPGFKSYKIFNKDLASVELVKTKLVLNRPIYVGFTILELSKVLMYDFHYNHVKSKYGSRAQLCFTDTDSLCYDIRTEDVYADMQENKDLFDLSEYPKDHPLYDITNKKVIGKMKDECEGNVMREFVGLKPKMYSFTYEKKIDDVYYHNEKKRAKGVKKSVVEYNIQHDNYRGCLLNQEYQMESMVSFRSYNHQIYTIQLNKTSLNPFDDKRFILNDGKNTLAHGHWRIA